MTVSKDWNETTLGEFAPFIYGKGLKQDERRAGDFPVFGSNGLVGYHDEPLTDGPTIIIGRKGTVGAVHLSNTPCWPIDTTFYITDNDFELLRFKYYLLKSLPLQHMNSDSAVPGLNRDAAHALAINVPPLLEQRAIAHILGTLDDKIELNRKMSATLEAMAQALFKAWFVDFEPIRAKRGDLDGRPRWQRGESLPGLPADLYDLFPDRLVESELGLIPQGWEISTIGKEVKVVGGGTPSTGEPAFWENGIHFFATPKDLSTLASPVLLGTEKKVTDAGLEKISSGLLPPGTVLMSSRAPVGYLAITYVPVCINQGFIAMLCEKEISNFYAFFWADANMTHIKQRASGTTFAEISKNNFRPMQILVPPKNVIGRFDDFVQPWFDGIALLERESRTLAALRDTLLPKLISGELRVKDAERFLEEKGL